MNNQRYKHVYDWLVNDIFYCLSLSVISFISEIIHQINRPSCFYLWSLKQSSLQHRAACLKGACMTWSCFRLSPWGVDQNRESPSIKSMSPALLFLLIILRVNVPSIFLRAKGAVDSEEYWKSVSNTLWWRSLICFQGWNPLDNVLWSSLKRKSGCTAVV